MFGFGESKLTTIVSWLPLLLTCRASANNASTPPLTAPKSPGNTGVFAEENVKAFSEHSIGLFYDDCEEWAGSFAWHQSAKLCDGFVKNCIYNYDDAVASCRRDTNGGGPSVNHVNNTVLPHFYVEDNIPYPQYTKIAVKGTTTMCQILEGFGEGFIPICYDFVQIMSFIENTSKEPFGLELLLWDGFYSIGFGSCPGYPTVDCAANSTKPVDSQAVDDFENTADTSGMDGLGFRLMTTAIVGLLFAA